MEKMNLTGGGPDVMTVDVTGTRMETDVTKVRVEDNLGPHMMGMEVDNTTMTADDGNGNGTGPMYGMGLMDDELAVNGDGDFGQSVDDVMAMDQGDEWNGGGAQDERMDMGQCAATSTGGKIPSKRGTITSNYDTKGNGNAGPPTKMNGMEIGGGRNGIDVVETSSTQRKMMTLKFSTKLKKKTISKQNNCQANLDLVLPDCILL